MIHYHRGRGESQLASWLKWRLTGRSQSGIEGSGDSARNRSFDAHGTEGTGPFPSQERSGFYVLEVGRYEQYRFAWYDPIYARYSDDCPVCPECGGAVGSLYWLEPRIVRLKQARRIGD